MTLLDGVCYPLPKVVCILVGAHDESICELDSKVVGKGVHIANNGRRYSSPRTELFDRTVTADDPLGSP